VGRWSFLYRGGERVCRTNPEKKIFIFEEFGKKKREKIFLVFFLGGGGGNGTDA